MNTNTLTCFQYRLALPNNGNATVRVEQKVNGVYQYLTAQQTQTTSGIFELVFTPNQENIRISVSGTSGFALQQISLDRDNVDTLVNTYLVSRGYRYQFNGMEVDNEPKGKGNSYTTEFRQYDPRLGRWLSLDPLMTKFPWQSPYVAFDNNPIIKIDKDGKAAETKIVEKSGKVVADIQDGSDQVFVLDKKHTKNVLKDLANNFGNNELILNSKENGKIGLKYGETLEKYSSLNSNMYDKDVQIYFDYGYDYQYKEDNPSFLKEPPQIAVLYGHEDSWDYSSAFNFGRSLAKNDISKGYMNRVNPVLKPDAPLLKITDASKMITIYIKGKESTLMELYEFNKK